jgi:hypothetical protein
MDPGAVVLNGNGKTPKVEIRAIAAGEVVVADDRSQLMQKIRRQLDDVAAVDMESFGVYETAHARQLPALAIRGISDCVGDKRADADAGWQPRAASYAAAFAFALLRAAEPEDLPGSATPGPPRPVSEEGPSPSSRDLLFGLPPNLWATYDWAFQRVGDPATDVLRQLVSLGEQPATWLSRIRHRTPPMLQARDSMPQWLLVAEFANAHEHQISSWLYEQAAERTTDSVERAFLFARATVVAQRDAGIDKAESLLGKAEAEEPSARPLWRLYDAALHQNIPEVLEQVQVLMRPLALGLSASVVDALGPVDEVAGDDDAAFVAFISEFNEQHPQLLDQLRVHVALIAGNALLISGKLDAAQMLFENLLNGLPALDSVTRTDLIGARSSTVLIQIARTLLTRIANMSSKEVGLDTDGVLARAEELALTARDRRLDWHGPTGEALAMAAHARARSGDTRGALHLLSPPPRGIALPSEASSQPVLQFAAELAVGTGDIDLALELAAKIEDAAERNIATGLALTLRPDSHSEAAAAFRTALATPPERIRVDQCVRALLALAMVTTLGEDEFARLEEVDPEVADVIRAQAFMTAGRVSEAQVLARRYPDNDAAVLIRVEGYLSQGKVSEALEALETYGVRHSEDQFFLRAASLAIGSDMPNEALRLAALVVSSSDLARRRAARELIVDAASRLGDWDRVLTETRRLIEDDDLATSDPDRETNLAKYRWARVHALHQQRRMGAAYRVIRDEPRLTPTDISKGQLVVSVLRSIAPEIHLQHLSGDMTAGVSQEEVLSLALEVAQAFPDDEAIVGTALMTSFAMPAEDPPDPLLMTKARQLQQRFFERFPESELIRAVPVDDSFSGLKDILRETLAPGAQLTEQMRRGVAAGQIPLSCYTTSLQRSYAEGLIRNAAGCYVIRAADDAINDTEIQVAKESLDGSVVIDTSALYLSEAVLGSMTKLAERFDHVFIATPQRDDIVASRLNLMVRSSGSLGWDPILERPALVEHPKELTDRWAEDADRLASALAYLEVLPDPPYNDDQRNRLWSSPIRLAKERGIPVIADDAALRAVARSEGVAAFGSLQLLYALAMDGVVSNDAIDEAYERLMLVRAAELPVMDRIVQLAEASDWSPASYASFLLTRPGLWVPLDRGIRSYMEVVRRMPKSDCPTIAGWYSSALYGLCWVVPPHIVPLGVGTLTAWTILELHRAELLPFLLDTAERVAGHFARDVDVLKEVVYRLVATIRQVTPPQLVAPTVMSLLGGLDGETHSQAVRHLLEAP